jgi:hypothetical protein
MLRGRAQEHVPVGKRVAALAGAAIRCEGEAVLVAQRDDAAGVELALASVLAGQTGIAELHAYALARVPADPRHAEEPLLAVVVVLAAGAELAEAEVADDGNALVGIDAAIPWLADIGRALPTVGAVLLDRTAREGIGPDVGLGDEGAAVAAR